MSDFYKGIKERISGNNFKKDFFEFIKFFSYIEKPEINGFTRVMEPEICGDQTLSKVKTEEDKLVYSYQQFTLKLYPAYFEPYFSTLKECYPQDNPDLGKNNNVFMPKEKYNLINQGIKFGWEGDWISAAFYLTPLFESVINTLIRSISPNNSLLYNEDGTFERKSTNTLFDEKKFPDLKEKLGEKIHFELKALFTGSCGLRTLIAHGYINDNEFPISHTMRLWSLWLWLIIQENSQCSFSCQQHWMLEVNSYSQA